MTRAALEPVLADFEPIDHMGAKVWIGCDLSQNKDLTATGYVVRTGVVADGPHKGKPTFDAWIEAWTPGDTAKARALKDKAQYLEWIKEGHLNAPGGSSIDYRQVAQSFAEATHEFDIQCVAYDRYAFKRGLEPACEELGLSLEYVEHPQGGVKKGKPNDAMIAAAKAAKREPEGLWMPMSLRQLEDLISERRIRIKANPVLISAMMSAVTDKDRWGNYWLSKEKATQKIDPAIALLMGVGAAHSYEGAPAFNVMAMVA